MKIKTTTPKKPWLRTFKLPIFSERAALTTAAMLAAKYPARRFVAVAPQKGSHSFSVYSR